MYLDVFKEGYIGVSFFFILSGFILAYNYESRILSSVAEIGNFLAARFARIYPLHLLTMLLAIPLSQQAGLCCFQDTGLFLANLTTNLFMIHGFFSEMGTCCYLNGPSWSISVEMFFYLLFPFLIFALRRKIDNRSVQVVALGLMVAGIAFLMWSVPVAYLTERFYYLNPLVRTMDFMLGIILFKVFCGLRNVDLRMNNTILELFALILFVVFFAFHQYVPQVYRYSVYYWPPISVLILVLAFQRGYLSRMLSAKWSLILGEISFAFYMFHQLVLRYMSVLYPQGMLTEIDRTILSLFFSLSISYISHRFFELPVGRMVKQKLKLSGLSKWYFSILRQGPKA